MKAVFEQISAPVSESILVRRFSLPEFDAPYHFHPEYELTWIIKGQGQRYIGRQVESFEAGDLVWVGPNVPHCWISSPTAFGEEVEALVVQFDASMWAGGFLQLPEMRVIHTLFQRPNVGWVIPEDIRPMLYPKLLDLVLTTSFDRLSKWMTILHEMGSSAPGQPIDPTWHLPTTSASETLRFHRVYQFLIQRYQENMTLAEVAEVAGMSITSFCRYFKGMTGKTFVEVLLEFRVQHACQQLRISQKSIQEITYESGFQDVSYFNKAFKKQKGMSPTAYRKTYAFG